ncbi:heme ABC transporter ATP-binding protein [uncultured Pedobacter sp.]|uniref:heme ABC transporter ATP-binding protein n=1 Tax=uncultured Pedobacter sp. TaxID=246139 RepID=UPI0025F6096D|nr:heme ABC transporter ATP-binding protein [uncultured Pedobacter sp.]
MLRVESISYKLNERPLLKDISFGIRPGEMVALLGSNGAGKSTLLRLLSGERKPDSGRIMLYGEDLKCYERKILSTKRAYLQQHNPISMAFTVKEIIMMGRYGFRGLPSSKNDQTAVSETMEICGLSDFAERSVLSLSGGEQQRVHLARVLAQLWDSQDAVLLLDEPTNNMDLQFQHQTLSIAAAMAGKGYMVIVVLHDLNLAAQYASRIVILKNGRKWWNGTPAQVLTPQHIYTAFGIQAETYTDQSTLKTIIVPEEVKLDAAKFNSNLQTAHQPVYKMAHTHIDESVILQPVQN